MTLLEEITAAFMTKKVDLADLPDGDPTAVLGKTCEGLFTNGVDVLRSVIPNERVRKLASVVWDLVGNQQVLVGLGPDVPSLSFTVMQYKGIDQAIILMPRNWPAMVDDDTFMQLGAVLFVGVLWQRKSEVSPARSQEQQRRARAQAASSAFAGRAFLQIRFEQAAPPWLAAALRQLPSGEEAWRVYGG